MQIRDVMTRDAKLIGPDDTLRHAAQMMQERDCGILPVADGDRLAGMITDRDIAIRAVAEGKGPDSKVRDAMTCEVRYCFEDEAIEQVCRNMGEIQVRRLPVINRDKRLVGILSLGDVAFGGGDGIGPTLEQISQPGGQHTQTG